MRGTYTALYIAGFQKQICHILQRKIYHILRINLHNMKTEPTKNLIFRLPESICFTVASWGSLFSITSTFSLLSSFVILFWQIHWAQQYCADWTIDSLAQSTRPLKHASKYFRYFSFNKRFTTNSFLSIYHSVSFLSIVLSYISVVFSVLIKRNP